MSAYSNDAPHLITAIDHRVDFLRGVVGVKGDAPSASELERAAELKGLVFAGLMAAIEAGVPKSQVGVWADLDLGEAVLLRARGMSLMTAAAVERPGTQVFHFDDVLGFSKRLRRIDATFAAARVHYNPDGDLARNKAHIHLVRRLSEICRAKGPRLLLELIVAPTEDQLNLAVGMKNWKADFEPDVLVNSIEGLQNAGIDPHVWVIDPPLNPKAAAAIAAQAHIDDRQEVGVLFAVGSGQVPDGGEPEDDAIVELAARTPGITGLLFGPVVYGRAVTGYHAGTLSRSKAVKMIARALSDLYGNYVAARRTSDVV
jgi:myo-inositol catabolism protein IolC